MGFSSVMQWISGTFMTFIFVDCYLGLLNFFPGSMQPKVVFLTVSEMVFYVFCWRIPHPMSWLVRFKQKTMTCRYLFVRNGFASTIRHIYIYRERERDIRLEVVSWFFSAAEDHRLGFHHRDVFRLSDVGRKSEAWIYGCHGNLWVLPLILPNPPYKGSN